MCRGRRDSSDRRNTQSPPVVIGEEQIDNMSELWKDEDKATLYEYANGRYEPQEISYCMTISAHNDKNSYIFSKKIIFLYFIRANPKTTCVYFFDLLEREEQNYLLQVSKIIIYKRQKL